MGEANINELPTMLDRQRRAFLADGPPSVAVRRERIDRLMALLLDNTDAFVEAMAADYGTPTLHCGSRGYALTVGSNAATRTPPDQFHAQLVERDWMTSSATDFDRRVGAAVQVSEAQSAAGR